MRGELRPWMFVVVLGLCVSATRAARADVTLQNDSFVSGGTADFMGGFVAGESGASRFVAPDAGRQLLKVQLLYGGGSTATRTETLKVWDDSAGTVTPGAELLSADFSLMGSDSAMQELDVSAMNVVVPQQFRVGLVFSVGGAPSIAADTDGNTASRNFIYAKQLDGSFAWIDSRYPGVPGDWVIRAIVNGAGGVSGDAGVTGQTCTGNAQCPMGQFCDLQNHACTFECRVSTDCPNGGTCNSLGMCVGGSSGGGGCCQAGPGEGRGAAVLALGVLGLVLRRRRQRA